MIIVERIADSIISQVKTNNWRVYLRRHTKHESEFKTVLREQFKEQKKEVKDRIKKTIKNYSTGIEAEWMFDVPVAIDTFRQAGEPVILDTTSDFGAVELSILVQGMDFDIGLVEEWAKAEAINYSTQVTNTTYVQLRQEFMKAIEANETIPEVYARVDKVYDFAEKYRAERIARTEVTGAANKGTLEAYGQSGLVKAKRWLTAMDERVRPEHQALDGEQQDLNDPFSNGAMFPGDPNADLATIINCRCTMISVRRNE